MQEEYERAKYKQLKFDEESVVSSDYTDEWIEYGDFLIKGSRKPRNVYNVKGKIFEIKKTNRLTSNQKKRFDKNRKKVLSSIDEKNIKLGDLNELVKDLENLKKIDQTDNFTSPNHVILKFWVD